MHEFYVKIRGNTGELYGFLWKEIKKTPFLRCLQVGIAGFEPTTSSSLTKRATKLRHIPGCVHEYYKQTGIDAQA